MSGVYKYSGVRKSQQSLNEVYFWTAVFKDWKHLLKQDEIKMIIIEGFQWLVNHEPVHIYGYVVMPNHIHVLWEQLKMNGKETPKESFAKFTGHIFLKRLRTSGKIYMNMPLYKKTGIISFGKEKSVKAKCR